MIANAVIAALDRDRLVVEDEHIPPAHLVLDLLQRRVLDLVLTVPSSAVALVRVQDLAVAVLLLLVVEIANTVTEIETWIEDITNEAMTTEMATAVVEETEDTVAQTTAIEAADIMTTIEDNKDRHKITDDLVLEKAIEEWAI